MSKITKLTHNYSTMRSKNYQSVTVNEGFEIEFDEKDDIQTGTVVFEALKTALKKRVDTEADQAIHAMGQPQTQNPLKSSTIIKDELEGL